MLIKEKTGATNSSAFQQLPADIKKSVLIELKGKRASLRQLERLTGISKSMIYRMWWNRNPSRWFFFSENLRIYTLRELAKRFVENTLGHSTYKQEEEQIWFPDNWLTSYSWGEKKALWVFKSQVTSSVYFHNDGTPDQDKLSQLKTEVDTGLWDNYLLWLLMPSQWKQIFLILQKNNKIIAYVGKKQYFCGRLRQLPLLHLSIKTAICNRLVVGGWAKFF